MFDYKMTHACSYRATLAAPEIFTAPPGDIRINFYVTGGEVWGPMLNGKVKPVGADWLTLRTDGICVLDVNAVLESDDGALIDVQYNGLGDLGPDGYAAFLRGEVPDIMKIRAAPRLRTAHPKYQWLNRTQFVNIGEGLLKKQEVTYDVYALG